MQQLKQIWHDIRAVHFVTVTEWVGKAAFALGSVFGAFAGVYTLLIMVIFAGVILGFGW